MSEHYAEVEPAPGEIPDERIRERAYELYEARSGGDAVSDWLQAERELRSALERASPLPEASAKARSRQIGSPSGGGAEASWIQATPRGREA